MSNPYPKAILYALTALALTATCALATTPDPGSWYVAVDGDDSATGLVGDPFATIQRAIDGASDGETVKIHDGIYTGEGNRDIGLRGKRITVRSISNNPAACVIDCGGTAEVPHIGFDIHEWGPDRATVTGLTIRGAWTESVLQGAITIESGWVEFQNIIVTGTHGTGMVLAGGYAGFTLDDCRIVDSTDHGIDVEMVISHARIKNTKILRNGGHGVMQRGYIWPWIYLEDCRIQGNAGAGVWVSGGWSEWMEAWEYGVRIMRCDILNNGGPGVTIDAPMQLHGATVAENGGGGVIALNGAVQPWDIDGSAIYNNGGDGIRARVESATWDLGITDTDVIGNRGHGLVLTNQHLGSYPPAAVGISGCLIANNRGHGAVLATEERGYGFDLTGCTLAGNKGAGIYWTEEQADKPFTLRESIIAFNGGAAMMQEGPGSGRGVALEKTALVDVVSCTDVYGNLSDWTGLLAPFAGMEGNLEVDPGFCDEVGYGLEATSPCAAENSAECGLMGARGVECAGAGEVAEVPGPAAEARIVGAFPNPFNPRTTLVYELPVGATVDMRIYDLKGRLVRSLVARETKTAGTHRIVWDGRDDRDQALATGVYLWRLQAGEFRESARMTLMK